ncbi:hypothetical protein [Stackebrandtia soli]|uniref:hypothetical protein n=1 Tax=Stackebrandtia soli TaxID=1892856 RepID=UPI0039E84BF4
MPPPAAYTDAAFSVHVDAIEDFQPTFSRLDARATTASAKIGPATANGLGIFNDATTIISEHTRLRAEYMARLALLRVAVATVNAKTTRVIANYRRTETVNIESMMKLLEPLATVINALRKD